MVEGQTVLYHQGKFSLRNQANKAIFPDKFLKILANIKNYHSVLTTSTKSLPSISKKGGLRMTFVEKVKVLEKYIAVDDSSVDQVMELAIEKLLKREATPIGCIKTAFVKTINRI